MGYRSRVYLRAYFNSNLGDDLFVEILARRYPDVMFVCLRHRNSLSAFPQNVRGAYSDADRLYFKLAAKAGRNRASRLRDANIERKLLKKTDAAVYVVGSGFMEKNFDEIREKRDEAFYAAAPFIVGCNFGPYETEDFLEKHRKWFAACSDVCFRDSASKSLFSGSERCEADIVFSYTGTAEPVLPEDFGPYQLIAPVSLERGAADRKELEETYISYLKRCIRIAAAEGKRTVLLGFCRNQGDGRLIRSIAEGEEGCELFCYPDISMGGVNALFSGAENIIAGRYHAAVLGILSGRPLAVLSYSKKTDGMLADAGFGARALPMAGMESTSPEEFLKNYSFILPSERIAGLRASAERQFEALDARLR